MKPPPNQPPPPKRFPWIRTTLVLGGLTAGVIVFSRFHTELPWCRQVDEISRPAIEQTCDTSAQAWDWMRGKWTSIGRDNGAHNAGPSGAATGTPANDGLATDPALPSMTVYFTPTESGSRAAVSRVLCSMIRSAEKSVVASYTDWDDQDVAQALIAAHKTKGVFVQAGVDNRNCMQPAVQNLIRAGVPVATDRSSKTVSANFLVIDGQVVCYGSVMPTAKSLYRDNNCMFTVADRKLAARFNTYFHDLYPGARPLPGAPVATPVTAAAQGADAPLVIDGLQAYLGNDGDILNRVVEQIGSAQATVRLLTPALNNDAIAEALSKAGQRGVTVELCLDRAGTISSEQQLILQNNKVVLTRSATAGSLGEAALVIDGTTVIVSSVIPRTPGLTPQHGIGWVMHSRGMAGIFEQEFDRVSRNRPAAPDGYAYELVRGHAVTPLMIEAASAPTAPVATRAAADSTTAAVAASPASPITTAPVAAKPAPTVSPASPAQPAKPPAPAGPTRPAGVPATIAPSHPSAHPAPAAPRHHRAKPAPAKAPSSQPK